MEILLVLFTLLAFGSLCINCGESENYSLFDKRLMEFAEKMGL